MLFTVVTPCFNSAHLLEATIESILSQSALQNGTASLEYWIIDGASTDDTQSLLNKYKSNPNIQIISEPDRGMYDALSKGLIRAKGHVVSYLNAGDIYHPKAFQVLSQVFKNPLVNWVTGYSCLCNEHGEITMVWKPARFINRLISTGFYGDVNRPHPWIQQESTFWRKNLLQGLDFQKLASLKLAGDYFLWCHFSKVSQLHSLHTLLGAFLCHDGQLSEKKSLYGKEVMSFCKKSSFTEKIIQWFEEGRFPKLRWKLQRFLPFLKYPPAITYQGSEKGWAFD